jgi:hypothetical protein
MFVRATLAVALALVPQTWAEIPLLKDAQGFSEKYRLSPAEVARLETHLIRSPGDLSIRARLLTHYFQFAVGQPRLEHILWVVKNRPESKLAGSPVVRVDPQVDTWSTRNDYEAVRALWNRNVEAFASNPSVLSNAARFFEAEDPVRSADLLRRSWRLDAENRFRRAGLVSFYKRILKRCESPDTSCPGPMWLAEIKSQLEALSPHR